MDTETIDLRVLEPPEADHLVCLDKKRWLKRRGEGLGSSDAPIVLNIAPWSSRIQLWGEKSGLVEPEELKGDYLDWGNKMEPLIADEFAGRTGREVLELPTHSVYRNRDRPHLLASPDRLQVFPDGEIGILELKNVSGFKAGEWEDEPPLHYQVQVQHQLLVTGMKRASIAALIGGNKFVHFDVEVNAHFTDKLIAECEVFWGYVERQEQPPEMDGSEATKRVLERLYPAETGSTVNLPPEAVGLDAERLELEMGLKTREKRIAVIKNQFRSWIGDNTFGVCSDGVVYSYKTVKRQFYVVPEKSYRSLRRKAAPKR